MKAGAANIEQEFSIELNLNAFKIRKWLNHRAYNFVDTSTHNLETVIESTLRKCRARNFTPLQTACAIRPMIGLNPRQAAANWKFQRTFVMYLSNPNPRRRRSMSKRNSISDEIAELLEKLEGALNYSLEQISQYARLLAEKNWVEEYNEGKYEIFRQAMELGLIGVCEKVWVTAEDEKVCRDCWMMSGNVAAFDEQFRDKQGNAVGLIPPLHPRCRCVVYYRRLLPPGLNDITPTAMSTPNTSPYLLGRVDPNDGEQLAAVIRHYEERISTQSIENAIIITAYGEVYHTTGDLNTVNPILLLGNKLNGATVTHNHPRDSANEYSFSGNDIELFMSHSIERLRGIDERFVYELNRNPQDSDVGSVTVEDMADGFGYRHFKVMEKAEELGIGYRRWRHE